MFRAILNDEAGFIVSAELALIFTLVFCAVAVGFSAIKDSLAMELHDVSESIGAMNQSYGVNGLRAHYNQNCDSHGTCSGFGYADKTDTCDCTGVTITVAAAKQDPSGGAFTDGTN